MTIFRKEYHGVETFQLSRQRVLYTYHHYMCPTFGHAPVIYSTLLPALYKSIIYIYIRAAGHVWHRPSRRWPKVSPTSLVWQLLVTLLVSFSLLRMAFHLLFTLDLRNSSSCFFSLTDMTEVVALVKGVAELPCDVTSPDPDDPVRLVLWYRTDSSTPIYR